MDQLRELYQEVILDHNKRPRNFGPLEGATCDLEGYNPLCGDRFTVHLKMDGDRIADIHFEGSGCAISTASASVMTESLKGKTIEEARVLFETFHDLVTGKAEGEVDIDTLGKLAVFAGVSEFPMRVKCATLSWHTTQAALGDASEPITTE